MRFAVLVVAALLAAPAARAQNVWDVAKKAAGGAATNKVQAEVNKQLLAEGRKNQCSFKTDSDELEPGCEQKMTKLANALVSAKKKLNSAGVKNYAFVVSGHTDTSGSADHNKELSKKRAAVIEKELAARGVPKDEIKSVGMGSDKPLVKPDDTPAKKAKNRRYEIQVEL